VTNAKYIFAPCNIKYILVYCRKALDEGRFTHSYDKVLAVVREAFWSSDG